MSVALQSYNRGQHTIPQSTSIVAPHRLMMMYPNTEGIGSPLLLRIMPLGGSITYGSRSSHGNGYRHTLREMLLSDGYAVDMVGSRKTGSMQNNDNEGWRGYRIDQVTAKAQYIVPQLLPDLFLVNVGSNDCVQDYDIGRAGERLEHLLDYLWEASPRSTIVLSTLLPNLDERVESRVKEANVQFRVLVAERVAARRKIILAEMHGPGGIEVGDLADGTHPNDDGYVKMAGVWLQSIREAGERAFIEKPETS